MKIKNSLVTVCLVFMCTNIIAQKFDVGHTSIEFNDSTRNRKVKTEIYYPTNASGENVPVASGNFPVLVFGHGFLMSWESYENYWKELVPSGYVVCFPTTEMGISPSHEKLGLDLKFVAAKMQIVKKDSSSLFFNSLATQTALMGHSMGGGASFIAAENNATITTLINFAAAETNPSAVSSAANINIPTLIFSGDNDCVTPPKENQNLMYNNLASSCKTQISIINGGHCYFADYNLNCTLGESFCNPILGITREDQQLTTFDFLKLWLDYSLYNNQNAFTLFNDSLKSSARINFLQSCNTTDIPIVNNPKYIEGFPNPTNGAINIKLGEKITGTAFVRNALGQEMQQVVVNHSNSISVNLLGSSGIYFIEVRTNEGVYSTIKVIKN